MQNKSKKTDMNDFEQSIVLSVTCIPMTQIFMLLAGSMPTGLALFLLWCPVIWQISAVFFAIRFFKNNPRKKMKAWSISDFCWIFCTCHYGIDDMGYVAFWMMPKGNQKRETQQNPMPLPPARSEKGNKNRGNPRNPLPHSCFPQKGKKRKGSNPKKAPNNKAAAPWCGCPALYSLSNYC